MNLTVQIPESKAYNSAAYLKNASVSKYSEERMKEMLLNDHAVSIMLYMKDKLCKSGHSCILLSCWKIKFDCN